MKFKSILTKNPNAFRLGIEIGEQLQETKPEVILIFCSVDYSDFSEIYTGIREVFSETCPIVLGGTGDGVYESSGVDDGAVVAMAINSEGSIKWSVASHSLENQSSYEATKNCLLDIKKDIDKFNYALVLSDFHADGTEVVKSLNENSDAAAFGGFVSDNRLLNAGYTTLNGEVFTNRVLILGIQTEEVISIYNGSGYKPQGKKGTVTGSDGVVIKSIDKASPLDFIENQLGKKLSHIDKGILGFNVYAQGKEAGEYLRSVSDFNLVKDELVLFGGVPEGEILQICTAEGSDIVDGVRHIVEKAKSDNVTPSACIIISCAGRKWLLGNKIEHEVSILKEVLGDDFPIIGFPSLGEISPVYTEKGFKNYFHNVTYVLALIGTKD